ncbi:sodium-dependent phosphate transport protein 2A-like [Babylonia areolata]|uniref:sodium-dependent phosphate transport protein 2A-like n=1 Tax=Babylonia areolata TaxID=304850 RepID=UPI003FD0F030
MDTDRKTKVDMEEEDPESRMIPPPALPPHSNNNNTNNKRHGDTISDHNDHHHHHHRGHRHRGHGHRDQGQYGVITAKADFKKEKKPWDELSTMGKCKRGADIAGRLVGLTAALYLFICSLGLLEAAFKLVGGRTAGEAFKSSDLLSNPVAGLMIGVMATVLVQSSSTATSIVVALVASEVIPLRAGIPIIMGTNIGTSITNTIVALAQAGQRDQFRRAFAGATVHDMFNWLAVMILLPLEVGTGFLYHLTGAILKSMGDSRGGSKVEILTAITKPFIHLIVQVNSDVITDFALADNNTVSKEAMLKRWCNRQQLTVNQTITHFNPVDIKCSEQTEGSVFHKACVAADYPETAVFAISWNTTHLVNITTQGVRCSHLFATTNWGDGTVGWVLLGIAFIIIVTSLFVIVKILNSLLQGHVAKVISKTINKDLPGRAAYFTSYLALAVGCAMTLVIQSSSVFTSTLTPLVGIGIVSLERMYPLTLGANIGTTVTGILAALSTQGPYMKDALQIALCHLFFNVSGTLLFFPIPATRLPVPMAKLLGRKTARYRWIAVFYLLFMFIVFPGMVFALSYAGWQYLLGIGGPLLLIFLVSCVVNVLQVKRKHWLPPFLRTWDFLPLCLHSLGPLDQVVTSCLCCAGGGEMRCVQGEDSDDFDDDDDDDDDEEEEEEERV